MPVYESDLDRKNETVVAKAVSKFLSVDLQSNAKFAPSDFSTFDGNVHVEIRCRNISKDKYPNIIVSASKWLELLRLKATDHKPQVFFAVCWVDYLGIIEVGFNPVDPIPFRRNRSIGTHKTDVMISLPVETFTIIGPSPHLTKTKNWIN